MVTLNITNVLTASFLVYIAHCLYSIYSVFHPPLCDDDRQCLFPVIERNAGTGEWPRLQLRIYGSLNSRAQFNYGKLVDRIDSLDIDETLRKDSEWHLVESTRITTYHIPEAKTFNLIGDNNDDDNNDNSTNIELIKQLRENGTPIAHFRSVLPLTIVAESPKLSAHAVPHEIYSELELFSNDNRYYYWPIFYVDDMSYRIKDLVQIGTNQRTINMTVYYRPISIGKLRLLISTVSSLKQLKQFGFSDNDIDQVKGLFVDTNFYLLAVTILVAGLHILFDVLAFKNDVSFWRNRRTMVGLSLRSLLWRCFSQVIIFIFLMDQETSLLVLIPSGIGCLIELWKVTKALKISIHRTPTRWLPQVHFGRLTEAEQETEGFDSEAMKYLIFLIIPLCFAGALYSLAYVPHKSWYSWIIQCLANGVYAFGFLFMLPQLFVNYRLKSVAHLPWRAFMYKAFNTFVDDLFAFIITMPTSHRIACFRDDIVFVIYLYQRHLYPVDKSRFNEYGESFDETQKIKND
ncbi:unnamed protein product [Anisakis simplex]|uniref:Lipid scramblase CLPTM1L n=1 Tax=Anisakis simplex TaxID=6269 RepID=A0A0M3JZH2_ANISI|nr:unnamed protein product [Anisakis simplex]